MAKIKGSFHFTKDNAGNLTGWFLHNLSISPASTTATLNSTANGSYIGTYDATWDDGVSPHSKAILEISVKPKGKPSDPDMFNVEWRTQRKKIIFSGFGMLAPNSGSIIGWYSN